MTDTDIAVTIVAALAIVVGIFGTFIPFVPGLVLSWLGILLWAIVADGGPVKWLFFGIATFVAVLGTILKYLLPGRNMKRDGVTTRTMLAGAILGVIGFFVVPVIGLFLGFVLGVFLAEMASLHDAKLAWPATWTAVKAVGMSMLVEVVAGLLILVTFVAGVLVT